MTVTYNPADPRFPDISVYRPVGDVAAFKAAKPVALGFRVCNGGVLDPTAASNDALAKSLDIPRIGYDFEHGGDAATFLKEFPPEAGRLPCCDCEASDLTMAEAETWVSAVAAAYKRLPLLYGHSLPMQWNPGAASILRKCQSWQGTYGMSLNPVPWMLGPAVWQYSDGDPKWASPGPRYFDGIGSCDMNTLRIPVPDLRKLAGIVVPPPPPPPPPPGGPVTDADAKQLGYSDLGSWRVQEERNKAISDVMLGITKRTGQDPAYNEAFDKATTKLATP
jgi:hypothetical protein